MQIVARLVNVMVGNSIADIGKKEMLLDGQDFVFLGPGLAIRVICAEDAYKEKDFAETQVILKTILDYANAIKKVSKSRDDVQLSSLFHV